MTAPLRNCSGEGYDKDNVFPAMAETHRLTQITIMETTKISAQSTVKHLLQLSTK